MTCLTRLALCPSTGGWLGYSPVLSTWCCEQCWLSRETRRVTLFIDRCCGCGQVGCIFLLWSHHVSLFSLSGFLVFSYFIAHSISAPVSFPFSIYIYI
ncbi:hypothetical protein BDV35DRAFT_364085 [Aspergillus flavus]|uniref:Uncharacterized protein n=1 Tax=Aspergillus flavus TaxID=5059 RepID=A0A5N6GMP8_ASPFL|nr:hypothetical protein BDV35DRAFT_364085 [Aspergillus flavus]